MESTFFHNFSPEANSADELYVSRLPLRSTELTSQPRPRVQLPLWALLVALSMVSLVAVGVLTFMLTKVRGEQAVDSVGASYRQLASTLVEQKVVGLLGQLVAATQQLAIYGENSPVNADDPWPEELRKLMITTLLTVPQLALGTGLFLGLGTGQILALEADAVTGHLFWGASGNGTANHYTVWPATQSCASCGGEGVEGLWRDSDWMRRRGEESAETSLYNSSQRLWYKYALNSSGEVVFAPTFTTLMPSEGSLSSVLAMPVVVPVHRANHTNGPFAVAMTTCTQERFDDLLKSLSSLLFPGTVVFLVEAHTGFLVASSSAGQRVAAPPNNASGAFQRIRADQATDSAVRKLSQALGSGDGGGWARFLGHTQGTTEN
eukprot:RCo028160